ncbi:MAG: hypothetical protein ACI93R_001135 [Flavobacteriales bacterium]|jgi:uncharacterized protein (TIGR00730 family)
MKSICVFCAAKVGIQDGYCDAARVLARELALRNITLIYGGTNVGVMGALADTMLSLGGGVVGVIPKSMIERGIVQPNLSELIVVNTLTERKDIMAERADGFIALPGGFGTLDELFDQLSRSQLNIHQKPIALLNTLGYFDALLVFISNAEQQGLLAREHRELLIDHDSPKAVIDRMVKLWE